ncbi:CLOCK-interacting pacemaker a isoform X2 [Lampris incognitus]|nr:CLOCK-interacting pacemaker a isoform X2 [Lampris incognitus]
MSGFTRPRGLKRLPMTMATHLRASKPESERDSGFSDASSGYLSAVDLTDSEDTSRTTFAVGQDQTNPQVAVMGGSYPGVSPMIIMNNFVVKQPNPVVPVEKQWGFPSSFEMMPQSQVVLLQAMVSNGNSRSMKTGSENPRQSKNYIPILKSYPKIAPHPGESNIKKQRSLALRRGSTPGYDHQHRRHHHGHRLFSTPSPLPGEQMSVRTISNFESPNTQAEATDCQQSQLSQPTDRPHSLETDTVSVHSHSHEFSPGLETNICPDDLSLDDKQKRFSNTYNILNKSGLLGITLRTKQLIKENRRTQGQLQQLQEQTALLMEALSSGNPRLWTKLQLALQDTAAAQPEEEPRGGKPQNIPV